MRRRDLLGGTLAAAASTPFCSRAQQKALPVVGYLDPTSPGAAASFATAFRQGLSDAGYFEGQNLAIEYRWAEGHYDRLPALAADLVERKVNLIATTLGRVSTLAAKSATSTIPIVFMVSATRSRWDWSPVSPDPAATSPGLATSPASWFPSDSIRCPNWFPIPGQSPCW